MIHRLRFRLIGVSMFSLMVVLTVIVGSANLINYRGIVEDADVILSILAENNGTFPMMDKQHKEGSDKKNMSPERPYESRFYSVLLSDTGTVLSVDTGKIAAVDTTEAINYAQRIYKAQKTQGFLQDYRYLRQDDDSGNVRVIFLDCGRSLSTFRNFLLTSCGISLMGLLAVFLLVVGLSGRIIRPVLESHEKQKQFITDAGHEIKTPITIIDADAGVLEMDIGENEWLQDIQNQTRRLASLTDDLIYLSRMEEGSSQFQMIEFPISDVVAETAQSFQALAKTRNIEFVCSVFPMLSMHGDEKAIRQLVSILLDNALKYTPEDGSIDMKLERQGRMLHLTLYNTTDTTVTRENLNHLFERFYRIDPSRNSQNGGHGIGLSIAKAIVDTHKGKIMAETMDGCSLLIAVSLPAGV